MGRRADYDIPLENGRVLKDYTVVVDRLERLGEYLAAPVVHAAELGLSAVDEGSPLAVCAQSVGRVISGVSDETVTDSDWDSLLRSQAWAHSKSPSSTSAVLTREKNAGSGGVLPFQLPPTAEDLAADFRVHGDSFIRYLETRWSESSAGNRFEDMAGQSIATVSAVILLESLRRREEWQETGNPTELIAAIQRASQISSAWSSETWRHWLPSMDFISHIFGMIEDTDGNLDNDQICLAFSAVRWFREQRVKLVDKVLGQQDQYRQAVRAAKEAPNG